MIFLNYNVHACGVSLIGLLMSSIVLKQSSCSCVETLVMLRAKFHVVSRLLTVLKNRDFDAYIVFAANTPLKIIFTLLLHRGLIQVRSQKKPRLHFGESFTLSARTNM